MPELQTELKPGDMGAVIKGLGEYNASKANGDTPNYLVLIVRDKEQQVVGGWSAPPTLAGCRCRPSACPRVFLETLSFQALPFYEKLGYTVASRIADFLPGGARYALTKFLGAQPA